VNSLPKTVTRQSSDCDLNPGPSAPESSMLTTRLPSHPCIIVTFNITHIMYALYCYMIRMVTESIKLCALWVFCS